MRMEENPVPTGPKHKKKNGARAVRSVRVELGVKQRRRALGCDTHTKAKQFFLERIFTLEEATDEAPESVVTAVCEILQDHSVDLLDRFEDNPLFL
ncbi:hypothetical protein SRHO_G00341220 [Serrasalmus rhombeus]